MSAPTRRAAAGRVMLVTRNLPPLRGGMERLVHHCYLELAREYDTAVVGPRGAGAHLDPGTPCRTAALRPLPRFLVECAWHALRGAGAWRPDLVFSGSGLTALPALLAGRRAGIPVVTYVHGLDIVADHPVYRTVFLPALRRCDGFIVNSTHTRSLAVAAGIDPECIEVLNPGVAIGAEPDRAAVDAFAADIGVAGRPIMLSAGRLTARKGLVEFVERCLPDIVRRAPDAMLVVVGGEASDAAAGASSGMAARITEAARVRGLAAHVKLLGDVPDATLSAAYAAAHVLVFPVVERPGDVEGFGMVAIEAAAQGTPTAAFAVGGVPDAVRSGVSGDLVVAGDYDGMTSAVLRHLKHPGPLESSAMRSFAGNFSWDRFGARLRSLCAEAMTHGGFGSARAERAQPRSADEGAR